MKNIYGLLLLSSFLLSLGCVKRPQLELSQLGLVSFKHTGTEATCLNCHTADRPAAINGVNHFNNEDCLYCHVAGSTWTNHNYHTKYPNPTSCNQCHEKDRKPPASGVPHGNGGDCVSCHTVGANWASSGSPHNPEPSECASCHAVDRPAPVNGYPHYNGNDCKTCHVAGGAWASYKLYAHSPVPTSCNSCHEVERPALSNHPSQNNSSVTLKTHYVSKDCYSCHKPPAGGTRAFSFVHTNANSSKINFCLPCHYTKGWDKHSNNPSYFTGDGLCFNCHNKGKSWAE